MTMTNEMIKIEELANGIQAVSGRDLHEFLEIKSNCTTWFNRMCEYGFVENEDYITWFPNLESENHGGQNKADNYLTLDMAKQICMIQRSEKGKQARLYFIEIEKEYKALQAQPVDSYMIQDPVQRAQRWIAEEQQRQALATQIEVMIPKIEYHDAVLKSKTLMTTTEIAADYGMSARKLNQILSNENIQYKRGNRWYLYSQHSAKGYTQSKTALYDDGCKTKTSMQWTQVGREFIYELLAKLDIKSVVCRDADQAEIEKLDTFAIRQMI